MWVFFYSDKSDIESQKGNNGRHQYSATGSGAGRSGGKTMVAGSLASIPPDALYTTTSKHTSVSTLSSKPEHEYENLKVRLEDAMSWMGHVGNRWPWVDYGTRGGGEGAQPPLVGIIPVGKKPDVCFSGCTITEMHFVPPPPPRATPGDPDPRPRSAAVSLSVAYAPEATPSSGPGRTVSSSHLRSMPTWPTVNTIVWKGTSTVM